jgi:acyl phosphate:glycerol-3-phosphate acyltransferase
VELIALSFAIGYLIGSVPTAYLVVRLRANVDIRESGSGNVGAANTFKVTRSKFLSVLVAFLDILKGVAAIYAGYTVGGGDFPVWATAGCAAVAGHNYSVWLGFRGGRGLATACGATITWAWFFPVSWVIFWFISKKTLHDTHYANSLATLLTLLLALTVPADWLGVMTMNSGDTASVRIFAFILCTLIFIGHLGPLKQKLFPRT